MLIELTKLNGSRILINSDAIELVEETPDTVVIFRSGRKIIVKESRQDIRAKSLDVYDMGADIRDM